MNYDKLSPERFMERLKADGYKGLGGARRAISKSSWTDAEKDTVRAAAEKYFGTETAAPKKAAKKVGRPKKVAAAAPAEPKRKVGRPKKVAAAPAPKRTRSAEAPRASHASVAGPTVHVSTAAPSSSFEEATRSNSAAIVIQSMRGTGTLSPLEQRTYAVAHEEYWASARESARQAVNIATHGVALPGINTPETVTAPPGTRVPVPPNGTPQLSAEEQEQLEKLKKGAGAIPAILGQGTPPTQA